jgi:hypothetical protein
LFDATCRVRLPHDLTGNGRPSTTYDGVCRYREWPKRSLVDHHWRG